MVYTRMDEKTTCKKLCLIFIMHLGSAVNERDILVYSKAPAILEAIQQGEYKKVQYSRSTGATRQEEPRIRR